MLLGRLDDGHHLFEGATGDTNIFSEFVPGPPTINIREIFPQVRSHPLSGLGFLPEYRLKGSGNGDHFRGAKVLPKDVLRDFTANDLVQVENGHGHPGPAQQLKGSQPPLPRNEFPVRPNDNRMQKPDFLNASGEGTKVAEVLAVASANPNGGNWNGLGGHVSPPEHREGDGRCLDLQSPDLYPAALQDWKESKMTTIAPRGQSSSALLEDGGGFKS
jgi:hypothetical protein